MIPSIEIELGKICEVSSSKRIFANEYTKTGIPFYRSKEIIEKHLGKKVTTELYISKEKYSEIKNKYGTPYIGDILMSSVGTIGVTWFVDEEDFYFKDGNLTLLRPDNNLLDNKYLYLVLNSKEMQNQIQSFCIGTTQKALTISNIKKLKVKLPSLDIPCRSRNFSVDDREKE